MNRALSLTLAAAMLSACGTLPFDSAPGGPARSQGHRTNIARFHYTGRSKTLRFPAA